jgi:hypothetical protein
MNPCLAEKLLASQQGLCPIKLNVAIGTVMIFVMMSICLKEVKDKQQLKYRP